MSTERKSPWPKVIIGSFVLLALFDAYIIKQAITTRVGTVTDNPYQDGLNYEAIVAGKRAANQSGISMEIKSQSPDLTISFLGLSEFKRRALTIKLLRPSDPTLDRTYQIESEDNHFSVDNAGLKSGLWLIRATLAPLSNPSEQYYFETKELIN